jgi:hypothetical protein
MLRAGFAGIPERVTFVHRCLVLTCLLLLPALATADGLRIPDRGTQQLAMPERGSTMAQVKRRFGAPETRHQQVGGGHPKRPPITRWDYAEFSVVFERERVINTVRRDGETAPVRGQEALAISSETLSAGD